MHDYVLLVNEQPAQIAADSYGDALSALEAAHRLVAGREVAQVAALITALRSALAALDERDGPLVVAGDSRTPIRAVLALLDSTHE